MKKILMPTLADVLAWTFFMALATGFANAAEADGERIVFVPLGEKPGPGQIKLANGQAVVDRIDWKTIFIAEVGMQRIADGSLGPVTCTATLIGPGVFLTAAHCLDRGASRGLRLAVSLKLGPHTLTATCKVSPEYAAAVDALEWFGGAPRAIEDYALCLFKIPTPSPSLLANLRYEVIDTESTVLEGAPLLLTGYGCGNIDIDANGKLRFSNYDYAFRIGNSSAEKRNSSVTISMSSSTSEPTFCPGDSGGPLLSGATEENQKLARRVRGVNSSIAPYLTSTGEQRFRSTAAALATAKFKSFALAWLVEHNGLVACGVNQFAGIPPCAH